MNPLPRVINLGSINIDHVYQVPHFVRPGETLSSTGYHRGAGGKGFNQSIALARAGQLVSHLGALGGDGGWLREKLVAEHVDTRHLHASVEPTGHAIIQVIPAGQNSIVLHGGANHSISSSALAAAFDDATSGDWLLTQNETNSVAQALSAARARGLKICLNPAPFTPAVATFPFECVDLLILNEIEGADLSGQTIPSAILDTLLSRWPHLAIVLTLGSDGAIYATRETRFQAPALRVRAVDTTAAGDTFIGYFLAAMLSGQRPQTALELAARAAAITVTRPGAADSIPFAGELGSSWGGVGEGSGRAFGSEANSLPLGG